MEKLFRIQKLFTVLFFLSAICLFVLSLGFMTDFQALFGLQLKPNKPVAEFHDMVLQGYNRTLFNLAIAAILVGVASLFLELWKKVPDLFATVIMVVLLFAVAVFACSLLIKVPGLEEIHASLDYSKVKFEGGIDYIPNNRMFTAAMIIQSIFVLVSVIYAVVIALSHFTFVKSRRTK